MQLRIDRFIVFSGFFEIVGAVVQADFPVRRVRLLVGERMLGEVELQADGGFHIRADAGLAHTDVRDVALALIGLKGEQTRIADLGRADRLALSGHALFREFLERIAAEPTGHLLEIGSRARSGVTRRDRFPPAWDYTGVDVMAGENVDVVGDAHQLSSLLPAGRFQAAFSVSVFEHLAMPWKVAVEMAKVMALGGVGYIQTHQTFPLHDEPWDFWRVSDRAWPALFNRMTGFEILKTGVAEPAFTVAQRWHPGVNHGDALGWSLSSVLVRKVCEPQLDWPAPLDQVAVDAYPG